MNTLFISMAIGLVAGIVDIIPMIIQKLNKRATISAFVHYFFISIVIININLPILPWWIQGSVISFALAIPTMIIVSANDKKAAPIIGTMAVVLGGLIGLAGHFFK